MSINKGETGPIDFTHKNLDLRTGNTELVTTLCFFLHIVKLKLIVQTALRHIDCWVVIPCSVWAKKVEDIYIRIMYH